MSAGRLGWRSAFSSFQRDHWNLAGRLRLILGEHGGSLHLPGVQPIPLLACDDDGGDVEGLGPDLDGYFWVSHQVVVPVRIGG